jgi:hypothetical protein
MAVMGGSTAFAGQILGFGDPYGPVYSIDAVTGNAVVVAPYSVRAFGASPSPVPGQFFITTGINLWTEDVFGGNTAVLGALDHGNVDLAYDAATGTLYGVDSTGLYTVDYSNCPGFTCPTTLVGGPPPGIEGIDFVSGAGIYGVSNFEQVLFRFDPLAGQWAPVGFTGIPLGDGVMDLAYDAETGAFVASVLPGVLFKPYNSLPSSGMLYRIDRNTGFATLLNGNAPVMLGLAENVPEPSTGVLLLSAIAALLLARRSARRGWCVYRFCRRMASSV